MRKSLLIVTCALLAGCTKTEETRVEKASAPVRERKADAPKPQVQDDRPVLAVLGDSLAEGFGTDPGSSFPDQLQRKLDAEGYSYHVVNLGISGDTTSGGVARMQSLLELRPKIVVLELGGNDGLRGVPIGTTRANLEAMIKSAKQNGAEVLLAGMTLPPNYGPDYIAKFEGTFRDLAKEYRLRLIPFLMEDLLAVYKTQPKLMQADGIHPTAAGHSIIAATVYKYLQPLLKKD